jgi:hypothetical protein
VLALLAAVVAAAKPPNGGKPTTPITTTTSSSGGSSSSRTTTTTSSSSGQAQPKDAILPNIHKVVASHKYLWPVNANTMVNITLSGAKDPAGGPVTLKIDHVTSTQPPKAYKAPLCPDSQIGPDADWVTLRAERLNNTARVYRIYYKATTSRGTFRKGVVWVCVPASNPNMENVLNSCPTAAKLFKKWNAGGCGGPGDYMGHNHLNQAPLKLNPPKLGDPIKPLPTTKTAAAAATGSPSKGHPHQPAASKAHPTAHLPKPDAQQPASTTTTAAPATSTSIPSSSSSRHLTAKSDTELIPFLRLTFKHAKCYQVDFASPPFLTNVTRLAGELVGFSLGKAGTVAVVKNGEDADCQVSWEYYLNGSYNVSTTLDKRYHAHPMMCPCCVRGVYVGWDGKVDFG